MLFGSASFENDRSFSSRRFPLPIKVLEGKKGGWREVKKVGWKMEHFG